jgi:hypothetical protein
MTDPQRPHASEPAEGDTTPGREVDHRTPHPQQPAEGDPGTEAGEGADAPEIS